MQRIDRRYGQCQDEAIHEGAHDSCHDEGALGLTRRDWICVARTLHGGSEQPDWLNSETVALGVDRSMIGIFRRGTYFVEACMTVGILVPRSMKSEGVDRCEGSNSERLNIAC